MCGIVGIAYKDIERSCDAQIIISMRDLQVHRGPDDKGLFIHKNVGLGHRRLSIIDLCGGHQPMTNEDGNLWIVYNGEIYNFKQIREELVKRGHIFKTNSDTEVILHLYEEKGPDCVKELNGMFAFAIWDKRKKELFLARDRMGIKPLYYVETEDGFAFSSEIKSLFQSGIIHAECNDEAIVEYFVFRDVSGQNTLFRGIKSLLPGHTLLFKEKCITINQYWSVFSEKENEEVSLNYAEEELSHLIQDAIKIRLMSEVPLGTFCSGGIDSSLVTAIAAQQVNHPINTFSVGFYEKDYDESPYAKIVSEQYGTNHHTIKLNNKEFCELLPRMIWQNDEPLNFANSIQIYAISKLAKEHVTVVLTGEGADELFAGYPRYYIPKILEWYNHFPFFLKKLMVRGSSFFKDHRIGKLKYYSRFSMEDVILYNSSFLKKDFILEILPNCTFEGFLFREESLAKGSSLRYDPITNVSILDQQNYLLSILNRQDKMSMAASIESRVPFLDHRIVELSNKLPSDHKINRFQTKVILKKIARRYLPEEIVNRKKSGFGVPLGRWLREPGGMCKTLDALSNDLNIADYFEKRLLEKNVSEHKSGMKDHSELLWAVINFQMWRRIFGI